ncbi:hypothetical protein [Leptolyngbya ohadii]|uniref:hypothetical protein n=1 Tax=Leptolyngbya ohadii TaxID=1962290 RepID=UPI000B5991E2|nr:hypothetical protein [Leptolyngbya ohadii]
MSENSITSELILDVAHATSQFKMFASTVRQFLEPHWLAAHQGWSDIPDPLSRWMCRYSSIFLATLLREQSQEPWSIVGGRPPRSLNAKVEGEFGILAWDGTWNDHCWVTGRGLIIDLTADQFGHDPIIVTASSDPRYRANLTEDEMAQDFQKLQRRSTQWLAAWKCEKRSNQ